MPSLREQGPWANLGRMGVAKFFLLILSASQILSARGEDVDQDCCASVRVETRGPSNITQSARMGLYERVDTFFERPVYLHQDEPEYLFYMGGRARGLWMVGPEVGKFSGGLANRAEDTCVENVKGDWKFADGTNWVRDPTLKITCEKQATECFYSDNIYLEAKGSDLVTIRTATTGQCIDRCVKTWGCRYWTMQKVDTSDNLNLCTLKKWKGQVTHREGYVSGSLPSACYDPSTSSTSGSGESGDPANKEKVCAYKDLEFVGSDLKLLDNLSFDDCKTSCEQYKDCSFFTVTKAKCTLKGKNVEIRKTVGVISGATDEICKEIQAQQRIREDNSHQNLYDENEINGKFRITSENWREELKNPESREFQDISSTLIDGLTQALHEETELSKLADFNVDIVSLKKGSVVCNFKIRYVLKEGFSAVPFRINPSNVTEALDKTFQFKRGILFQRFVIASGSFLASSPVDHCDAKGCSHKCAFDYDLEDYMCTCPKSLILDPNDNKTCIDTETKISEVTTTLSPITISLLPSDCLMSEWSKWSDCSEECGLGTKTRSRTVQIPERNGGSCNGKTEESSECNIKDCDSSTASPIANDLPRSFSADTPSTERDTTISSFKDFTTTEKNLEKSDRKVDEPEQDETTVTTIIESSSEDQGSTKSDEAGIVLPVVSGSISSTTKLQGEDSTTAPKSQESDASTTTKHSILGDDDIFSRNLPGSVEGDEASMETTTSYPLEDGEDQNTTLIPEVGGILDEGTQPEVKSGDQVDTTLSSQSTLFVVTPSSSLPSDDQVTMKESPDEEKVTEQIPLVYELPETTTTHIKPTSEEDHAVTEVPLILLDVTERDLFTNATETTTEQVLTKASTDDILMGETTTQSRQYENPIAEKAEGVKQVTSYELDQTTELSIEEGSSPTESNEDLGGRTLEVTTFDALPLVKDASKVVDEEGVTTDANIPDAYDNDLSTESPSPRESSTLKNEAEGTTEQFLIYEAKETTPENVIEDVKPTEKSAITEKDEASSVGQIDIGEETTTGLPKEEENTVEPMVRTIPETATDLQAGNETDAFTEIPDVKGSIDDTEGETQTTLSTDGITASSRQEGNEDQEVETTTITLLSIVGIDKDKTVFEKDETTTFTPESREEVTSQPGFKTDDGSERPQDSLAETTVSPSEGREVSEVDSTTISNEILEATTEVPFVKLDVSSSSTEPTAQTTLEAEVGGRILPGSEQSSSATTLEDRTTSQKPDREIEGIHSIEDETKETTTLVDGSSMTERPEEKVTKTTETTSSAQPKRISVADILVSGSTTAMPSVELTTKAEDKEEDATDFMYPMTDEVEETTKTSNITDLKETEQPLSRESNATFTEEQFGQDETTTSDLLQDIELEETTSEGPQEKELEEANTEHPQEIELGKATTEQPQEKEFVIGTTEQPQDRDLDVGITEQPQESGDDVGTTEQPQIRDLDVGVTEQPQERGEDVGATEQPKDRELDAGTTEQPQDREIDVGITDQPLKKDQESSTSEEPVEIEPDVTTVEPLQEGRDLDVTTTESDQHFERNLEVTTAEVDTVTELPLEVKASLSNDTSSDQTVEVKPDPTTNQTVYQIFEDIEHTTANDAMVKMTEEEEDGKIRPEDEEKTTVVSIIDSVVKFITSAIPETTTILNIEEEEPFNGTASSDLSSMFEMDTVAPKAVKDVVDKPEGRGEDDATTISSRLDDSEKEKSEEATTETVDKSDTATTESPEVRTDEDEEQKATSTPTDRDSSPTILTRVQSDEEATTRIPEAREEQFETTISGLDGVETTFPPIEVKANEEETSTSKSETETSTARIISSDTTTQGDSRESAEDQEITTIPEPSTLTPKPLTKESRAETKSEVLEQTTEEMTLESKTESLKDGVTTESSKEIEMEESLTTLSPPEGKDIVDQTTILPKKSVGEDQLTTILPKEAEEDESLTTVSPKEASSDEEPRATIKVESRTEAILDVVTRIEEGDEMQTTQVPTENPKDLVSEIRTDKPSEDEEIDGASTDKSVLPKSSTESVPSTTSSPVIDLTTSRLIPVADEETTTLAVGLTTLSYKLEESAGDEKVFVVDDDGEKKDGKNDTTHTLRCRPNFKLESDPGTIPMECQDTDTLTEPIIVVVSGEGLDLESISRNNIKIVVKEFMLMDMKQRSETPKK